MHLPDPLLCFRSNHLKPTGTLIDLTQTNGPRTHPNLNERSGIWRRRSRRTQRTRRLTESEQQQASEIAGAEPELEAADREAAASGAETEGKKPCLEEFGRGIRWVWGWEWWEE